MDFNTHEYPTALRTICLRSRTTAALRDLESAAIEIYCALHEKTAAIKAEMEAMNAEMTAIIAALPAYGKSIQALKKEMQKWGPMAGYTDQECRTMGWKARKVEYQELMRPAMVHQDLRDAWLVRIDEGAERLKKILETLQMQDEEIKEWQALFAKPMDDRFYEMVLDMNTFNRDLEVYFAIVMTLGSEEWPRLLKRWNEDVMPLFERTKKPEGNVMKRIKGIEEQSERIINATNNATQQAKHN